MLLVGIVVGSKLFNPWPPPWPKEASFWEVQFLVDVGIASWWRLDAGGRERGLGGGDFL